MAIAEVRLDIGINHMKTMRAVRYLGPKQDFQLQAVAIPEPGAGAVRVKIAACGMCHTELHLLDGLLDMGRRDFTVGHEIAGVIEAVGEGVPASRIGERVIVYLMESCLECQYCRVGDEHLCPAPVGQAGFFSDGGYADYIVTRARNCVPVPAHVKLHEIATMGCAGTTAVHAGKMAGIKPGEWVVVNGVGGVGFALLQYALLAGAKVIGVGIGAARLAKAMELGAHGVIDAAETPDVVGAVAAMTGSGADVVFELVGAEATMQNATKMLRPRGRLVLIGYEAAMYNNHPLELILREAKVMGSVGCTLQDLHDVVALVADGKMRAVVDLVLPLDDFATGLAALEAKTLLGRAVLVMA
jgi:propanol-preferring alcohol dehydrogenase